METLLLALSPFAVALVTQGVKRLQTVKLSDYRVQVVRVVAVLFSFLATVFTAWASGGQVDAVSIDTFVNGVFTFLGATGVYFLSKKSTS